MRHEKAPICYAGPLVHALRHWWLGVGFGALAALPAARAEASVFDLFGAGTDAIALSGAEAATATNGAAACSNPAGLAFGSGYGSELGGVYLASQLQAEGQRRAPVSPLGFTTLGDADVPLEGALHGVFRVGMALYLLPTSLMEVSVPFATEATLPYYEGRTDRFALVPALGVRLTSWFGVGVGASVLADLQGPSDIRTGQSGAAESEISQDVTTRVAPSVGLRLTPAEGWALALSYRRSISSRNNVESFSELAGEPLDGTVVAEAFFTPDVFVLGAAWQASVATRFELDVSYARWSAWEAGPGIVIRAELPGTTLVSRNEPVEWQDAWSLRAGATHGLTLGESRLELRGSLGYDPSIVPDTLQRDTTYADADKLVAGLGVKLLPKGLPIEFSLAAQHQRLLTATGVVERCTSGCDGRMGSTPVVEQRPLTASGGIWALSAGVGARFP